MVYREDELISAFHKSLRKGHLYNSCFFGKMICNQIGVWKFKQYIFYIVFEETNNIDLYNKAKKLYLKEDKLITDKDIYSLVYSFVKSSKKWEITDGQELLICYLEQSKLYKDDKEKNFIRFRNDNLFSYGMWGNYLQQYDCYSHKMNKFKDISYTTIPDLFSMIEDNVLNKNIDNLIYLSYVFYENKDKLSFECLEQFCHTMYAKKLFKSMNELSGKYNYVFSYVLLFYSFLNELTDEPIKELESEKIDIIINKINNNLKNNQYVKIPLYALDKHTSKGKNLLSNTDVKFNVGLPPNVDLRLTGSHIGVKWRVYAYQQYNTIDIKWEDVLIK